MAHPTEPLSAPCREYLHRIPPPKRSGLSLAGRKRIQSLRLLTGQSHRPLAVHERHGQGLWAPGRSLRRRTARSHQVNRCRGTLSPRSLRSLRRLAAGDGGVQCRRRQGHASAPQGPGGKLFRHFKDAVDPARDQGICAAVHGRDDHRQESRPLRLYSRSQRASSV